MYALFLGHVIVDEDGMCKIRKLDTTGVTYDKESSYQRVLVGLANTGTHFLHPSGSLQVRKE
jgi:hypothetical protein